jgi:hypothetical protein
MYVRIGFAYDLSSTIIKTHQHRSSHQYALDTGMFMSKLHVQLAQMQPADTIDKRCNACTAGYCPDDQSPVNTTRTHTLHNAPVGIPSKWSHASDRVLVYSVQVGRRASGAATGRRETRGATRVSVLERAKASLFSLPGRPPAPLLPVAIGVRGPPLACGNGRGVLETAYQFPATLSFRTREEERLAIVSSGDKTLFARPRESHEGQ